MMKLKLSGFHAAKNTLIRLPDNPQFNLAEYNAVKLTDDLVLPMVYAPDEKAAYFQLPEHVSNLTACEFLHAHPAKSAFTVTTQPGFLNLRHHGRPVFDYHHSTDFPKPFWGPVYAPNGKIVTREIYPEGSEEVDHPWQRGLFTGHGAINGVECWNEPSGTSYGRCIQQKLTYEATPVFFSMFTENTWVSPAKQPLLDEARLINVFAADDAWIFDWTSVFTANHGTCSIGSTKEAGFLAIRLNPQIQGDQSGLISNAYGAETERECWGKHAQWVDYSGRINGESVGVAILDHPDNLRHPASWHVRDYGLFAHNIWLTDGAPFVLESGSSWTMKYRIVVHNGTAASAGIKNRYLNFENEPIVEKIE